MSPVENQSRVGVHDDDDHDSDIEEIIVIQPTSTKRNSNNNNGSPQRASPVLKRRKSSPQMDPIPTYTPTPLHILEQRTRGQSNGPSSSSSTSYYPTQNFDDLYDPAPVFETSESISNHIYSDTQSVKSSTTSQRDEYTPSLYPSRHVISCDLAAGAVPSNRAGGRPNVSPATSPQRRPSFTSASSSSACPRNSSSPPKQHTNRMNTPRPVSSALAQAVSRRRNSLVQQAAAARSSLSSSSSSSIVQLQDQEDQDYAEQPVMWSPKLPSQIAPAREQQASDVGGEDYGKYKSLNAPKARVAHKPTIPKNKQNRPKVPMGTSKKVPIAFRAKYLDVIINEYLNTGHDENESYQDALKDEQALATRAANKNIYVNLVAGLKKKIREKAGISTLPQDEDPKYVNGNKVVSHEDILIGKAAGTFSIQRKRKLSDPAQLGEFELYDRLLRYVMPLELLDPYGYPSRDPENPELRLAPMGKDGLRQKLRAQLATSYTCERCAKVYRVDEDGLPLATTGKCIFHPGHLWNERINRALEKRYSCCKGDPSAGGCSSNQYHIHRGELELENYLNYAETQAKPERDPNKHGIYALDCEMCYTTYGLELTRVTVINHKSDVVYEKLVKPKNQVLDYNTKFSGIRPGDLDRVETTLEDVQRDLLHLFSDKTILVGHSLDSDMRALKMFHKRFIDTAQLFPHKRGLPYKRALRTLMVENLRVIIQEDAGHDSKEDACAAFRLVMWKAKTDVPEKAG